MLPSASDDCDDCVPEYARRQTSATLVALLPFILTFFVIAAVVHRKLFPLLSGWQPPEKDHGDEQPLPLHSFRTHDGHSGSRAKRLTVSDVSSAAFAATIALSTVLVELLLCEISNTGLPAARSLALRTTLSSLIFLLIFATPALEIHSIVHSARFRSAEGGKRRLAWILEILAYAAWLAFFWYLGKGVLGTILHEESYEHSHSFTEGCLERIGVIGVSLMASLAGFAAVSSLWQTFGIKTRAVTEADIGRKQAGLDATNEMLQAKQSRLRAIQRKISDQPPEGFMTRVISSVRGNADMAERKSLELEVSGLETMRFSLSNSLMALQNRRAAQKRASTPIGKLLNLFSVIFSIYCLYRISATSFATFRRLHAPHATFASTDPINNFLALLAKHWDPSLDRAAWSRQISFLLSGVMLLASFNSALQTFLLFARLAPGLLAHAQANIALLVSQVSATYVISSALLLRSNLPPEVRTVVSDALGAPLEPVFVERWFEAWFLAATALTALGIWVGRKVRGVGGAGSAGWDADDLDDAGDLELGKLN